MVSYSDASGDDYGTDYWGSTSSSSSSSSSGGIGSYSGLFKGIGSLFGGISDKQSSEAQAQSYAEAADIAGENARLEEDITRVKEYQEARRVAKAEGALGAGVGAAGFEMGGSGMYLMRDTAAQGGLAEGLIGLQGQMEENSYLAEQAKARGMSKAASAAGDKSMMGGVFGALSSLVSLF